MSTVQPRSSFVLIPGAGGMAWYWHRLVPLLEQAGHDAIAVDLPADDARLGLQDYADIVVRAIGDRANVVLVAQSLAGFSAPLVCARTRVRMLIFVNAMIPRPGETAGAWWQNTGSEEERQSAARAGGYSTELDLATYLLHDVPQEVLEAGPARPREQSDTIFKERCPFERWPEIPIHVLASAGDRFFPLQLQRRIARERLGRDVDVLAGGHLVALSNPEGLAERLLRLERERR